MRLDKFLSNLKYGTRTEIKKYAKDGLIRINEMLCKDCSIEINPNIDQIYFKNELVFYKEKIFLMMNKPKGCICATISNYETTVLDYIKEPYCRFDLKIIGRLDKDTTGLLLLTTSGELVHKITSPNHRFYKTYLVTSLKPLSKKDKEILENGVQILDKDNQPYLTKNAKVEILNESQSKISICEGKFHQVKRMYEAIGNKVLELHRISIGNIQLEDSLISGEYKEIEIPEDFI